MIPLQIKYFQWQSVIPFNLLLMESKWFPFETKTDLRKSKSLDSFWLLSGLGESIIECTVLNCPRVWKGSHVAYCHFSDLKVTANYVVGLDLGADLKTNPHTSERPLLDFVSVNTSLIARGLP